jgi:predicted YcjX-like family ATPase
MVFTSVTDRLGNAAGSAVGAVSGRFSDRVIRLGVTGLSRAGKTVFITSLVANLLNRERMPQLLAASEGRIQASFLQPQSDDTVARFDYEANLDSLLRPAPQWPGGTHTISQLRLSFRLAPQGLFAPMAPPKTVHLDIVDYPGEWLLDLGLLDLTYDQWSKQALQAAQGRVQADAFCRKLKTVDGAKPFDDVSASELAKAYAAYLTAARHAGFSNLTPGRMLLPGDLAGSPVLTFAPLPSGAGDKWSLRAEMQRRFEAYQEKIVKPFFRDHFAKLDRQIVLVDLLKSLTDGPAAVADLEQAMTGILRAFRPGKRGILRELLRGRRIDRILFAASKADHLHHAQHGALQDLVAALTQSACDTALFKGALTSSIAMAALRSTVEIDLDRDGQSLPGVKGLALESGRTVGFYSGAFPAAPTRVLAQARAGAAQWEEGRFHDQAFAPAPVSLPPGYGPPHIRLDKALQFLIGDVL